MRRQRPWRLRTLLFRWPCGGGAWCRPLAAFCFALRRRAGRIRGPCLRAMPWCAGRGCWSGRGRAFALPDRGAAAIRKLFASDAGAAIRQLGFSRPALDRRTPRPVGARSRFALPARGAAASRKLFASDAGAAIRRLGFSRPALDYRAPRPVWARSRFALPARGRAASRRARGDGGGVVRRDLRDPRAGAGPAAAWAVVQPRTARAARGSARAQAAGFARRAATRAVHSCFRFRAGCMVAARPLS